MSLHDSLARTTIVFVVEAVTSEFFTVTSQLEFDTVAAVETIDFRGVFGSDWLRVSQTSTTTDVSLREEVAFLIVFV